VAASSSTNLNEEAYGQQYLMSIFLGLGDGKSDNLKIDKQKRLIAIDTEMAFRPPIKHCEGLGAVAGNYSALFRIEMAAGKINNNVKHWLLQWSGISPEEELKNLFYLCFKDSAIKKQFSTQTP
jgi:hypothetical protein